MNLLEAQVLEVTDQGLELGLSAHVKFWQALKSQPQSQEKAGYETGQKLQMGIRPEHWRVARAKDKNAAIELEVSVLNSENLGAHQILYVRPLLIGDEQNPVTLTVNLPIDQKFAPSERLWLSCEASMIHLFS